MSEIRWLDEALDDLERLSEFLRAKNPEAARKAMQKIMDGANRLLFFPHYGRLLKDGTGRRELSITFGSGAYVLWYVVEDDDTVVIFRVWHSREQRS